jgi:tetratricopeptide (TPR) repeat protein
MLARVSVKCLEFNVLEKVMHTPRLLLVAPFIIALAGCATPLSKSDRLVESGYQHILSQDWAAAETDLLEALEANADNVFAMLNLGVVYQETDRGTEAIEMYNRVIDSDTKAVATRSNLAEGRGKPLVDVAKRNVRPLQYDAANY